MCGILGYAGRDDARRVLHDGLRRLEYRGYDSAGLVVVEAGALHHAKTEGRVEWLDTSALPAARTGVAHTRWATHGPPTILNAHPHVSCDGRLAVAHNGIIDNDQDLRRELKARGHHFASDTDSEVVAHLLEEAYDGDLASALAKVASRLEGTYALVAVASGEPGVVAATRRGSPLVIGYGEGQNFVASDVVAFRAHTDLVAYLEDGDVVRMTADGVDVRPSGSRVVTRVRVAWKTEEATLAGFAHFMLKEIHDQPRVLHDALLGRTAPGRFALGGTLDLEEVARLDEVVLTGCGSSAHAALAAKPLFRTLAGVPARVALASEFPDEGPLCAGTAAVLAVTQSGETADTLAALRVAKRAGFPTVAVANVVGSTATREADAWIPIRAGPEVSVAATKSFSSQLLVLHAFALQIGLARGMKPRSHLVAALESVRDVPAIVRRVLDDTARFATLGRDLAPHEGPVFVLGRGPGYPVALETALKIKEVSYLHAEGLPSGELKHGPLALVERGVPAVCFAADGPSLAPSISAMREVAARGGVVTAITDAPARVEEAGFRVLALPAGGPAIYPYTATVAGQIVAYHAAVARGCDVDRPRNLAKSVTVG